jgi:hypothetical protein
MVSHHFKGDLMKSLIVIAALILLAGCQISHPATVMVNPETGDRVLINQHGNGKLRSALAARWSHESDVEALKAKGYKEEGK